MSDGVVKTSIYCVVGVGTIRGHTTCIVETRPYTHSSESTLTCISVFYT